MTEVFRCFLCAALVSAGHRPPAGCVVCKLQSRVAGPLPAKPVTDPRSLRAVPAVPLATKGSTG